MTTREREDFIAAVSKHGMDLDDARKLLRAGTTLQRLAELACSSEAADRDRIDCPAVTGGPCLCEHWSGCGCPDRDAPTLHHKVPRIRVQEDRTERRVLKLMAAYPAMTTEFQGDPRGAVLRVTLPDGRTTYAG